jgi:tRNA modification GTPase
VEAIEGRLLQLGARRATPGEYTRRAVEHGRMDLIDAEALAALLFAQSTEDLVLARTSGREAVELRDLIAAAGAAFAEASGAEDHPLETAEESLTWRAVCGGLAARCTQLAASPSLERRLLEGRRVVLLGPVNVGKSSLFNALLDEQRAIVHERPGTTRDSVSAPMTLGGRRIALYDTAGAREASGVERAGIEMGLEAARRADLVVWVEDVSAGRVAPPPDLRVGLFVENKVDLLRDRFRSKSAPEVLAVSAKTGAGIERLREAIAAKLGPASGARSARQVRILQEAASSFAEATEGPEDLGVAALERGVRKLGELVSVDAHLADEVYRRFCIGK